MDAATHSVPVPQATRIGEVSISLSWPAPAAPPAALDLHVRIVPHAWEAGRVVRLQPTATFFDVDGLLPTASYEFRLQITSASGAVATGKGYSVDTLPAGCGSGDGGKKATCALQ